MLLVAITGPVGSSKSTSLCEFATAIKLQDHAVDGFVSIAGEREQPDKGADEYTIHWMTSGDEQLFAKRDKTGQFRIDPMTLEDIDQWSKWIPARRDLVVLDEFGKWEAEGNGLMPYWPAIVKAKPRMVVVTLRDGCQHAIEERMGRKFDRVLKVDDPGLHSELHAMFAELKDWETVGAYGAGSGALEVSLGSWLHGIRFPFVGTIMGSLQASTLALVSTHIGRKELTVWVSTISAGLKTLSPAGSRITPMIAIAVQGFLFTLGATLGRWSKLGIAFGAFLVGLWAALQGFFLQYLLLGRGLNRAWDLGAVYLRDKLGISAPSMWTFVAMLCVVNGLISIGLTLLFVARRPKFLAVNRPRKPSAKILRHVTFWVPLALVSVIFLVARQNPWSIFWMILRAVAVVLAFYGISKVASRFDLDKFLKKRGWWGPSVALQSAKEATDQNEFMSNK